MDKETRVREGGGAAAKGGGGSVTVEGKGEWWIEKKNVMG
jgi:hypothetical protein